MDEDIFEVTEEHLKLLRQMYVDFDESGYDGAPAVDIKRPYGNSCVPSDIIEILGWMPEDSDEDLDEELIEKALKVHQGTATALQIALVTGKFEVGTYEKEHTFNARSWVKI